MPRFGQYLQKAGLLRREQLEEALQHQAVYGGRLGTVLVELSMLSIEQLAERLSDFHKIPLPPRKWLVKPQRSAIARVSRPLVERVRFVPLRLDGTLLHVATLDPRDPRVLDDLRFATGCRIEPYVLPEIWMHDWLYSLFNVPRGIRHIEVAAAAPAPAPAAAPARRRAPAAETEKGARPNAEIERAQARANAEMDRAQARMKANQGGVSVPPPRAQTGARDGVAAKTTRERAPDPPAGTAKTLPEAEAKPGSSVRPPPVTVNSLADIAAAMARTDFQKYGVGAMAPAPAPAQPQQLSAAQAPTLAAADWEPPTQNRELVRALSDEPEVTYDAPPLPPLDAPPAPAEIPPPPAALPPPPVQLISPVPKAPSQLLLELEGELLQVGDRERLIDLALQIASGFAQRVALFIVQRGLMQGVRCLERGQPRAIEGVLIPSHTDSMLTLAAGATEGLRVDPRARALDARVLELLGDEGATEVGLYPVAVKQRVVNVLYASNGGVPLGAVSFAALSALAEQMGMAYGRLILSKKGAGAA
jgi:hypothetical protein